VADGVEGFVEFFDPFVANSPVRDIQVVRSIVDGNYVFVHVYQDINDGEARWVITDLFDTDDTDKIVEHWDVIAAYVDDSVSGHTQVDGIEAFQEFMEGPGKAVIYKEIFKLIGQGDLIMSYSLVNVDGTDMATFDLFRVVDGLIVEHWDNSEPVPDDPLPNTGKF
jgi:predicted SnoaL-like aldol condensation-catalyzing enzyme